MMNCLMKTIGMNNNKGMALLVTLALISVLAAAGLELGKRVRNSADLAMEQQNKFIAEQMAVSGIYLAMAILAEDANTSESDSIQETWADTVKLSEAVNSLYNHGEITLSIVDELGKIQINSLLNQFPGNELNEDQRMLWERLLDLVISSDKSVDLRDPSEIINCLKDWMDSEDNDTITGISGAESSYYQDLDPPYSCSNQPFDMLDELFMVKGVEEDLLKAADLLTVLETEADLEGSLQPELGEILTVFGMDDEKTEQGGYRFPGTININTANEMVLSALLPPGMEDQAQELVSFRAQKEKDEGEFVNALDKGWYEQVIELSDTEGIDFENMIQYSSDLFKAECSATVNSIERSVIAYIKRTKDEDTGRWRCRILRMSRI